MIARIASLFRLFTELTGNEVVSSYMTQGEAREWLNAGFTEDDLRLMVAHRKRTIRDAGILRAMLRWRFIIGDVQRFAEDLPEAKAQVRNKVKAPSERDRVLEATGRTEKKEAAPKTAGLVMSEAGRKAFEEFCQLRKQLET